MVLLGLSLTVLTALLLSLRTYPDRADSGFNPGEELPSIMVEGHNLLAPLHAEERAILVLWSTKDAESRAVHAWLSQTAHLSPERPALYSLCVDADEETAKYYAMLDNVNPQQQLWGTGSSKPMKRWMRQALKNQDSCSIFYTTRGKIQSVERSSTLWKQIQRL